MWYLTLFSSWMIWNLTFSSLNVTESNNTRYEDFPGCRSFWRLSRQEIIFGLPSSCSLYHTEGYNIVRNVYLIILYWIFSSTIISTSGQEEKQGILFWAHQNAYERDVRGVQGFTHHHSICFFYNNNKLLINKSLNSNVRFLAVQLHSFIYPWNFSWIICFSFSVTYPCNSPMNIFYILGWWNSVCL